MGLVKKTRTGMIGCLAHCRVCNWSEEGYKKAVRYAHKHCKETGHTVDIERVVNYQYFTKK